MSGLTIQQDGQRLYLVGDSYPHRSAIKALGGHWDNTRKQWWLGTAKRAALEAAIAQAPATPAPAKGQRTCDKKPDMMSEVSRRVTYKGKDYYQIAQTRDGEKVLLVARNGAFQFWAAREVTHYVRTYDGITLGRLIDMANEYRKMTPEERENPRRARAVRDGGTYECEECGDYVTPGSQCWETGARH